jgi:putative ABC transport system permease protein
MNTVAPTSGGDSGLAARHAIVRWAWRLFRREWRQQFLVLALLTVAVAAATGFASAAYNMVPVRGNAEFGTANHSLRVDGLSPDGVSALLEPAEEWFGTIDVIGHRPVPIPGSVDSIDYRTQEPRGPYGGPLLDLRDGRYPTAGDEVAATDHVADVFALDIGATFAVDGVDRTVVGLVENPSDLDDEFALVAPSAVGRAASVTILVDASSERVGAFRPPGGTSLEISARGDLDEGIAAAIGVLGVAAVVLLLVSLVAAASFVVVAQRRQRQLGMLGAIGATERHLRLVVVADGAAIGIIAASAGALIGVAAWVGIAPRMESAAGFRIDAMNIPWWVVATAMALVVVTGTAAASWPARAVARLPITSALSGRPPVPRPAAHSARLALILLGGGVAALVFANRVDPVLIVVGTVATIVGVLLLSPTVIQGVAAGAAVLPIAARLAVRDLSRSRARSGAALAAISLTLGVCVAMVVSASAAEQARGLGNVSDRQVLVWTRDPAAPEGVSPYYTQDPNDDGFSPFLPRLTPVDIVRLEADVNEIAASLGGATVTGLDLAVDPAAAPSRYGRPAVTLAQPADEGSFDVALVFVATPEILKLHGRDLNAVDPNTEILTVPIEDRLPMEVRQLLVSDELHYSNVSDISAGPVTGIDRLTPSFTSLPDTLITPEALLGRGWDSVRVGWLLESSTPITAEQLAVTRGLATDAGLLVEARRGQADLVRLRWGATAAGMLLVLGVLGMTVGLIRAEAARDVRNLTAAGATSTIRRTLTATTAGALAFLGAMLGTAGAYVTLATGYVELGHLFPLPGLNLVMLVVGVPVVAAFGAWLLAGGEPSSLARQQID